LGGEGIGKETGDWTVSFVTIGVVVVGVVSGHTGGVESVVVAVAAGIGICEGGMTKEEIVDTADVDTVGVFGIEVETTDGEEVGGCVEVTELELDCV
jgi:hypothetical protein